MMLVRIVCFFCLKNYFLDKSFVRFVNHPSMAEVKQKAIFLHVCVPGQEDHAPDFVGEYVVYFYLNNFRFENLSQKLLSKNR